MQITIPTTGSRGDVQPYVALGVCLRSRGHEVCLATHADFESFVRGHGLEFYALDQGGQALQASDTGDRMLRSGTNALAFLREFTELRRPLLHELLRRCWLACRGADVILATNTELLLAEDEVVRAAQLLEQHFHSGTNYVGRPGVRAAVCSFVDERRSARSGVTAWRAGGQPYGSLNSTSRPG